MFNHLVVTGLGRSLHGQRDLSSRSLLCKGEKESRPSPQQRRGQGEVCPLTYVLL